MNAAMPLSYTIAMWIHVAAAVIALVAGPLSMLTKKGGRLHRRAGIAYVVGMSIIFVTSLIMSIFNTVLFLIAVAFLTFYSTISGTRVLDRKRAEQRATWVDYALGLMTLAVGLGLLGSVVWSLLRGEPFGAMTIVIGIFGFVLSSQAGGDLRDFLRGTFVPQAWLFEHIARMCGSYIGLITALMVQSGPRVGLPDEWAWVAWILPTIIGSPWIARYTRAYRARREGHRAAQVAV
jgi:uncharacterized membrane protein